MKTVERIRTFTNKHPLVGPAFYWVSIQYFITMTIVAIGWAGSYSFTQHTISDLGNTACGIYSDRFVCSPFYSWMNASFVVLGATMIAGSTLIYQMFRKNSGTLIGFSLMAIAGFGTILVGVFPENTVGDLHFLGAALALLIGNAGLVVLGISLDIPRFFRYYTILSGVISLVALAFFAVGIFLGLGKGGMERLAAHPQTIWLIAFGVYMSEHRYRELTSKKTISNRH